MAREGYDKNWARSLARDRAFMQKKQKAREEMTDKQLYYAGIGSRQTPDYALELMEALARKLREDSFILRTGHAPGADQAFECGAEDRAQIFLPWRSFEQDTPFYAVRDEQYHTNFPSIFDQPTEEAYRIAMEHHPAWHALSNGAASLHARNVHQILGPNLARPTPVEFVICWTPDGQASGGTGQAMRIAEAHEIPIWNLYDEDTWDMAFEWAWAD
jgi:hypothetical protein